MTEDVKGLARELRAATDSLRKVADLDKEPYPPKPGITDLLEKLALGRARGFAALYDRAADALEAKLTADREALAKMLCRDKGWDWETEEDDETRGIWYAAADRLLASGVIKRVPTAAEIVDAINGCDAEHGLGAGDAEDGSAGATYKQMAEAVHALMRPKQG